MAEWFCAWLQRGGMGAGEGGGRRRGRVVLRLAATRKAPGATYCRRLGVNDFLSHKLTKVEYV